MISIQTCTYDSGLYIFYITNIAIAKDVIAIEWLLWHFLCKQQVGIALARAHSQGFYCACTCGMKSAHKPRYSSIRLSFGDFLQYTANTVIITSVRAQIPDRRRSCRRRIWAGLTKSHSFCAGDGIASGSDPLYMSIEPDRPALYQKTKDMVPATSGICR